MSFHGNNDIKCSSTATAALSKKTEKKTNIFMLSAKNKQTVSELQVKKKTKKR